MMRRLVNLLWAFLLTAFTPVDHAATPLAPPAIVAGNLAWADRQANHHGLEPCAAGKTPW